MQEKVRAKNNRTTFVTKDEKPALQKKLLFENSIKKDNFFNKTICGELESVSRRLPERFVDLLFIDPPYNLNKDFGNNKFKAQKNEEYTDTFEKWLLSIIHTLKESASVYVCCDWQTSPMIFNVLNKHLKIRNRITWEREKGRGALSNWKNCSEDIWFATLSDEYTFNVDSVKLKKKVIAPYKEDGVAKDWTEDDDGKFRLTHPSNFWTDITIPFWSMPENTDHPTQKPEKLVAKIILASTNKGDVVLDPFLGSGTTSVVSKKLDRKYVGIDMNEEYCCLAEKRLARAENEKEIQGYFDGVFWERNSLSIQNEKKQNLSIISKKKLKKNEQKLF